MQNSRRTHNFRCRNHNCGIPYIIVINAGNLIAFIEDITEEHLVTLMDTDQYFHESSRASLCKRAQKTAKLSVFILCVNIPKLCLIRVHKTARKDSVDVFWGTFNDSYHLDSNIADACKNANGAAIFVPLSTRVITPPKKQQTFTLS